MLCSAKLCTPSKWEEHGDQGNKEERERHVSSGKLKAFNISTNTPTSTDNAAWMGERAFMRVPRTAANRTDPLAKRQIGSRHQQSLLEYKEEMTTMRH